MTSRRSTVPKTDRESYEDFMRRYRAKCGEPMLVDCRNSMIPSDGDPTGTFNRRP